MGRTLAGPTPLLMGTLFEVSSFGGGLGMVAAACSGTVSTATISVTWSHTARYHPMVKRSASDFVRIVHGH